MCSTITNITQPPNSQIIYVIYIYIVYILHSVLHSVLHT